jgi:sec-independent protein translocase protein TatC
MFDATAYFDLFFVVLVVLGLVFQIPVVTFVLSRFGLVTAGLLLRNLKYAVFVCTVLAAVVTPTPDFGNMLIIAGPMIVLYCLGIVIAWLFGKRRSEHPTPS